MALVRVPYQKIIAGHPSYEPTSGSITYEVNMMPKNLFDVDADVRSKEGIFLGFQYPVEIPGVTNFSFLLESYNEVCAHQGLSKMEEEEFNLLLHKKLKVLEMDDSFLHRPVNEGFSGGEKKKNEILQMIVLNPRLALLDETDSGLDIDALKIVADGINAFKKPTQCDHFSNSLSKTTRLYST